MARTEQSFVACRFLPGDHRLGSLDDAAVLVGQLPYASVAAWQLPPAFHQSKRVAIVALALGLLKWLIAFLSIGGESGS